MKMIGGGRKLDENRESILLLEQIAQGSGRAFDLFYEKHCAFIYHIAMQIVESPVEAEDICHDVFLEVFQKYKQYKPSRGSVKAWLAVKTKSRSIDLLRKKQPLLIHKLEGLAEKEARAADLEVLSLIERKIIYEALNKLPTGQREAIYRSYFQGATHKEIASRMGKPLGSVKSMIRYGLNNLRKQKSIWSLAESGGGEKKNEI